jgi:hypothetical protein
VCFAAGTKISTLWGMKNIENVNCNDFVITPFGVRKVLKAECTGIREVMDYKNTIVTYNHPFFIRETGFVRADALMMNSNADIMSLGGLILWRYKKLLYLMENNIDLWGREGIISANLQPMMAESVPKDCMLQFGNFIAAKKYKKMILFIIKMVIVLITTTATWSVFQGANIWRYMLKREKDKKQQKSTLSISQKLEEKPHCGMEVTRGKLGIENMLKRCLVGLKSKNTFVSFVKKVFKVSVRQRISKEDFVRHHAIKSGAISLKIKSYKQNVVFALDLLKKRFLEETKAATLVEEFVRESLTGKIEKQKVYNITVDKDGVYYANKFLVSNCDALAIILNNERQNITPSVSFIRM